MYIYKSQGQPLSIKDIDVKNGIMTGILSDFHQKDSDGDIIKFGAYTKTIQEWGPKSNTPRIKWLIDHDKSRLLGKFLVLEERQEGLYYEGKVGKHADAQDFLLKAEDELISEHSVYINPVKQSYNKSEDANIITEVKMWEGSSLHCWGANSATPFLGFKSEEELIGQFAKLYKALHHGTYSDATMIEFQEQYNAIGKLLKSMQPDTPGETTEKNLSQSQDKNLIELFKNTSLNGIVH
ncbi:HK97 family phage prohead protease [Dyadobacter sp. CY351]|uniref:HK97 family phage prohead protease n=1 Tax=Dyadobacter sp. CY351 TaxID=2909337 RepID=UPI001F1FC6A9|nr:HK97 family phage prohead protease [Dyadobacter sp. CY351]MCF2517133.1 HK97 family phage prohead protease [Dyadobacter sp. CY351]